MWKLSDASVPFKYDPKAFLFLVVASSKLKINKNLLLATTENRIALGSYLNGTEASESFHRSFLSYLSLIKPGYHDKIEKSSKLGHPTQHTLHTIHTLHTLHTLRLHNLHTHTSLNFPKACLTSIQTLHSLSQVIITSPITAANLLLLLLHLLHPL